MILKSRFVVPVHSPVIRNGAVAVSDGIVTAVDRAGALSGDTVIDYGDSVITPGFVNAHTHLELTSLAGRVPPTPDFTDWLMRLVAMSGDGVCRESVQRSVRAGVEQSLAAGVTVVGDITRHPDWCREALGTTSIRGVSFGEVIAIGNRRHLLEERLVAAVSARFATDRVRIGVSPHAPYTVEPDALRVCAARAREGALPLCIHLAETEAEERFTKEGDGPFADYLRALGVWDDSIPVAGLSPVGLAKATGLLDRRTVLAHVNYVSDEDLAVLGGSGASVAFCPRTHNAFGHRPHRYADMMASGINVCIGTDGLASNPSLSVLDELRFLRGRDSHLSADRLLAMGTSAGAAALGLAEETGVIRPGMRADLVVIPLDPSAPMNRWEAVLESTAPPMEVYAAGLPRLRARPSLG